VRAPLLHVLAVAEGAHHHESGAEFLVDVLGLKNGDVVTKQWHLRSAAAKFRVSGVIGVMEQAYTRREQLRARRRNH
jgi:hypothetical protein